MPELYLRNRVMWAANKSQVTQALDSLAILCKAGSKVCRRSANIDAKLTIFLNFSILSSQRLHRIRRLCSTQIF